MPILSQLQIEVSRSEDQKIKKNLDQINIYASWVLGISLIADLFITLIINEKLPSYGTLRVALLFIFQLLSWTYAQNWNNSSRAFITLFSIYLTFFIYPIMPFATKPEENIFLLFIVFLIVMILPVYTYKYKYIKWAIGWQVLIAATFSIGFVQVLEVLKNYGFKQLPYVFFNEPMILLGFLASAVFLIYIVYFLHIKNHKLEISLVSTNIEIKNKLKLLSDQKKMLEEQKNNLEQVQEELNAIQDNLRTKVKLKRKELNYQKEELTKFGFMNSHLLRAPISRLKGLMQLNILIPNKEEKEEVVYLMKESLEELDLTSNSINEILTQKNKSKLEEVEKRIAQIYGNENQ